jgi:UrcA family protein
MNTNIRPQLRAAIFCLCGAATLCALQVPASAADYAHPSRRVSFADLDISKPAGAKVLYSRIKVAAQQVCVFNASRDLRVAERERACIKETIDDAVKRVNSTALTELHSAAVIHLASH